MRVRYKERLSEKSAGSREDDQSEGKLILAEPPAELYIRHPSARVVVEASPRAESCLPTGTPNSRMNSIASWLILDISRIVDVKRTLADKPTVAYACSSNQADDMLKRCR